MPKLMDTNDHRAVESEGERSPMQVQGLLECAAEFAEVTERYAAEAKYTVDEQLCVLAALLAQRTLLPNDNAFKRDNLNAITKTQAAIKGCAS